MNDQDHFVVSRAYRVNRNEVSLLILTIDANKPRDKQLAPVKALILACRNYSPNYSSKYHITRWWPNQLSVAADS